jgi:hypothetical protein
MRLRSFRRSVTPPRTALPWALGALWALSAAIGCGGDRYIVIGSARAYSTAGWVDVTDKAAKSTEVKVHLEYLHPVDSFDPSLHAYVVWFEDGTAAPVRAGSLKYAPDERTGELKARSPYRKFVVKVTAEANDTVSAPSAFVVATQDISTVE